MSEEVPPQPHVRTTTHGARTGQWAVIFSNQHSGKEAEAYGAMAERMGELARTIDGFCGIESVRSPTGFAITISYWDSEAAILTWRNHPEHLEAQRLGRELWYDSFDLHIAEVGRSYQFGASPEPASSDPT